MVKRRRERLRRLILSLSCLPSAIALATPLPVVRPHPLPQTKKPCDRYRERQYTPPTSCEPSQCSTQATRPTTATKNERDVDNSYASRYRCSATTIRPETRPQTSLTPPPEQSVVTSSSWDRTTKPRRLQEGRSFMEWYKSSGTTPTSTLSTTQATPPAARPQQMLTNCSSSEILRCPSRNLTFSIHRGQLHRTNHTPGRHHQTSTTAHERRPLRSSKSSESYPDTTGIVASKECPRNMTTPSRDWEGARFTPPSIGTTFSQTTQSSCSPGDATVPVTRAPSEREKTPIPEESLRARRGTHSSLGRLLHQWSTSPSNKKETRPSMQKCSAFAGPMITSETWPKTWPTSKNCTMTCVGKNKILYEPLHGPTPSAASSHASCTMPRQPQASPEPCSTPASTTSPMDGSTAPNNTTNSASGAKGVGTLHAIALESTSACCATGTDTKSNTAESPISDAEREECAASLMITPGWPTPTAHWTSGPSDDGKDVNKGVMSREMSHT
jgi:hypothetical protein